MSRFLAPRLASLEAYVPGEQPREMEYVKLNTNESPYPPCPAVEQAVSPAAVRRLNLYPDPAGLELRRALAARYGLSPENVLLGNGSDEILNFAFTAFASPEKGAACPDISYGFYPVFAALHGLPLLEVPLKEDFTLCPEDYYGLDRLIVLPTPTPPPALPSARSRWRMSCAITRTAWWWWTRHMWTSGPKAARSWWNNTTIWWCA